MASEDELDRAERTLDALKEGLDRRAEQIQPNQCPGCGSYRLDGLPPEIHEQGCPWYADGLDRSVDRMLGLDPSAPA